MPLIFSNLVLSALIPLLLRSAAVQTTPSQSIDSGSEATNATPTNLPLSQDESFNFEILVAIGEAPYRGADITDVLKAANAIVPGDFQSHNNAFYALANQTKTAAQDPYYARNPINVRDTYFAASNYFRNADFYLHGNWSDPLIYSLWAESLECFENANAALPVPGERLELPASGGERFTIEARYFCSRSACSRLPANEASYYHSLQWVRWLTGRYVSQRRHRGT